MTDIIRINEPVHHARELIHHLNNYTPDWSRNTMNNVNELMSQFYVPKALHELHSQFYGWLPKVPEIPSTQGDPVTWGILAIIALILLYKL